jgi:HEAT repeat protein
MAAKQIILKIIELDENIAGLKAEFEALPPKDQEEALDGYFNGELEKIGEDDDVPVGIVRAAEMLLSSVSDGAAGILGRGLVHPNLDVRLICQDALAHLAEDGLDLIMPLVENALKKGGVLGEEVPFLIAEVPNPAVPQVLERFLKHGEADVVASAIEALADYGDPASASALESLLSDKRMVNVLDEHDKEVQCSIGQLAKDALEMLSDEEE